MSDEMAVDRLIQLVEAAAEFKEQSAEAERVVREVAALKHRMAEPVKIDLIREGGKIVGGNVHRGGITQKVTLA